MEFRDRCEENIRSNCIISNKTIWEYRYPFQKEMCPPYIGDTQAKFWEPIVFVPLVLKINDCIFFKKMHYINVYKSGTALVVTQMLN